MNNFNLESLDITQIRWGKPPAPLLPKSFREAFGDETLPYWVTEDLGLIKGSKLKDLDARVWDNTHQMPGRVRKYLLRQVQTSINSRCTLQCFDFTWPVGLDPYSINWTKRTRLRLEKYGLLSRPQELTKLTYGDLWKMDGAGALVVLDFTSTLEGVVEQHTSLIAKYTQSENQPTAESIVAFLEGIATEPWCNQVSEKDRRFASLLPVTDRGTLSERIERYLSDTDGLDRISELPVLLKAIPDVRSKIAEIHTLSLEESLFDLIQAQSRLPASRLEALKRRLGWNGDEPLTLDEAGQLIGITRERMRQIQKKFLDSLPDHELFLPKLDEALEMLTVKTPLPLVAADSATIEAGLSKRPFSIISLLDVAALARKSTELKIEDTRTGRMLVGDNLDQWFRQLLNRARRLAGMSGVSSTFQVRNILLGEGHNVDLADVSRLLRSYDVVDFLDEDWFWVTDIPTARNRLRNVARKMLSVVSPQSVSMLRDGVRRAYRWRTSTGARWSSLVVPPVSVMSEFFKRHPDFSINEAGVSLVTPVEYQTVLGDTERIIVDVLRSSPAGVLDRHSFAEGCIGKGVNEATFSTLTSYSPIVEHVGVDLWKLRGTHIDPAVIEAYRISSNAGRRERRQTRFGWNDGGKLWLATEIPPFQRTSLVVGVPSAVRRYIAGQKFDAFEKESDEPCGTINIADNGSSWGYSRFVRSSGLDENDVLLIEFDLAFNQAHLSVAEDDLLFE